MDGYRVSSDLRNRCYTAPKLRVAPDTADAGGERPLGRGVIRSTALASSTYGRVVAGNTDNVDSDLVLSKFLDASGRLITMPRRRTDRLVVLQRMAESVEPGREHDEVSVNTSLRPFHDDVAMLRRYLVDEGLLLRRPPGIYQRPDANP